MKRTYKGYTNQSDHHLYFGYWPMNPDIYALSFLHQITRDKNPNSRYIVTLTVETKEINKGKKK